MNLNRIEEARIQKALRDCRERGFLIHEPMECVKKAVEEFGDSLSVSCSFGSCSVIVLHMALRVKPNIKVVFNDTGVEYPETYAYRDLLCQKWDLNLYETKPLKSFWQCVKEYGFPLSRGGKDKLGRNPGKPKCCSYLKELPFKNFAREHGIKATLTGLRAAESRVRMFAFAQFGQNYYLKKYGVNIMKFNPIAFWTHEQVWRYLKENNIPINRIYLKGADRSGCMPCVTEDTLIYGDNIAIAKVNARTNLLGYNGNLETPLEIMHRRYSGEIYDVKVRGFRKVSFTPEHPILTCKCRKHVKWIKTNRVRPRLRHDFYYAKKVVYELTEPVWKKAADLEIDDYVLVPRRKSFSNFQDSELAWLLGLYLAEGWTYIDKKKRHMTIFTLEKHEKDLIKKLCLVLKRKFGSSFLSERKTAIRIYCCGKKPYYFFTSCGKEALRKEVPLFIKQAEPRIVKKFLEGYLAGDGYKTDNYMKVSSVNQNIAYDILELLLVNLGILPSLHLRKRLKPGIQGRNVTIHPVYTVSWSRNRWKESNFKRTYFTDGSFVYIPIKKIDRRFVENIEVWNLATPSETYCVPFIVHNCTGFKNWQRQLAKTNPGMYRYIQKLHGVSLLEDFLSLEEKVISSCAGGARQAVLKDWF